MTWDTFIIQCDDTIVKNKLDTLIGAMLNAPEKSTDVKRRNFIKLATSASAIGLFPFQITNALNIAKKFVSCEISNRKLVLIYLGGGNDGLNTIIPLNQYDLYSNLRPTIKIPDSGLNSFINLDLSLGDSQQIGLHPSLTGFKDIYDAGNLRILQSVGYPSQNKSHFASTDIYNTGNDGNSWLNGGDLGGLVGLSNPIFMT